MVDLCPTCGRPTINHDLLNFTNKERKVYQYINRHPDCTSLDITAAIYQEDIDGGPKSSSIIAVYVNKINKKIAPLGLQIKSTMGAGATYSVRKVVDDHPH